MFDGVKGQFVKAVGDGVDPKSIPRHMVAYYDDAVRMFAKFGHYSGVEDVPYNDWPLICLMADLKARIDKLEAAQAQSTLPLYVQDGEPDPTVVDVPEPKKHWKTRQAEERRAATVGV